MLGRADDDEVDAGPRHGGPERLCVATRAVKPVNEMLRFVLAPDGAVVADVKGKLPGRGVWVTASRTALAAAMSRKAFGRSFRRDVKVPADLVEATERLLVRAALDALAIAHKSGRVAVGFGKVEAALKAGPVVALIHAADAGTDGIRKLDAAGKRRFAAIPGGSMAGNFAVINVFRSTELDLALGRSNVVHAALLAGPASAAFLQRLSVLERFRGEDLGQGGAGE